MRIVKNTAPHVSHYNVLDNRAAWDRNLSLDAVGLLRIIFTLPDNWDFSVKGLSKMRKDGVKKIQSALNELIDRGYCERRKIMPDESASGRIEYEYTFYEVSKLDVVEHKEVIEELVQGDDTRDPKGNQYNNYKKIDYSNRNEYSSSPNRNPVSRPENQRSIHHNNKPFQDESSDSKPVSKKYHFKYDV